MDPKPPAPPEPPVFEPPTLTIKIPPKRKKKSAKLRIEHKEIIVSFK